MRITGPQPGQTGVEHRMQRIITTYVLVVLMLSLGFFGVGTLASAKQSGAAPPAAAVSLPDAARDPVSGR